MQSEGYKPRLAKAQGFGDDFKVGGGRLSASAMRVHRMRSTCALSGMSEFKRSAHQRAEETSSENGQGLKARFNLKRARQKAQTR